MEGLFGILIGTVFLISIILNAAKKVNEVAQKEAQKEADRQEVKPVSSVKTDSLQKKPVREINMHKKMIFTNKTKNERRKKRPTKKEFTLTGDDFKETNLIKGIIFKEILDQPRAKKPYNPYYR
jgi:hypothetical protein